MAPTCRTRACCRGRATWARADEFDAVVVAAANLVHVPVATAALDLGLPVVVDKPLALTSAEAAGLCALADARRGLPLTVFQNRRWDSDTLTAQRLLREGALGKVHRLESRFTRFRPEVTRRWREDAAAGGGVLLDLGAHLVDQAVQLLGPGARCTPRSACGPARSWTTTCSWRSRTRSGAASHLSSSVASPWPGPRLVLQGSAAGWSRTPRRPGGGDAGRPLVGPPPSPTARSGPGRPASACRAVPGDWAAFYAASLRPCATAPRSRSTPGTRCARRRCSRRPAGSPSRPGDPRRINGAGGERALDRRLAVLHEQYRWGRSTPWSAGAPTDQVLAATADEYADAALRACPRSSPRAVSRCAGGAIGYRGRNPSDTRKSQHMVDKDAAQQKANKDRATG